MAPSLVLYIHSNAFIIAVMFMILLNIFNKKEMRFADQRLFAVMLSANILVLFVDILMVSLDGQSGQAVRIGLALVSMIYYILSPVISYFWVIYVGYHIHHDYRIIQKKLWLYLPIVINTLFSVMTLFGNYCFVIDENNVYHRGPWFAVMFLSSYFYMLYGEYYVFKHRKVMSHKMYHAFMWFLFPPFFGGLLQVMIYGVSTTWTCAGISLFISFISLRNHQLHTDFLTGLYNRRQLEAFIEIWDRTSLRRTRAGIMIDLDYFKQINDVYGHAAGDQALEFTADILRNTFTNSDLLFRYGGDEFVAIVDTSEREALDSLISRLRNNLEQFNQQSSVPFQIRFSLGYDLYNPQSGMTRTEFISHIDQLMYKDKKLRKPLESCR